MVVSLVFVDEALVLKVTTSVDLELSVYDSCRAVRCFSLEPATFCENETFFPTNLT